jgi:hypothetical protein
VVAYLCEALSSAWPSFVSWFGSYQRLQGTYSFLAYVTIGGLTAATMRRPEQVRRVQHAVIITSLAASIYGIVQHYGLDPLPWGGDVQTRVAANAGNAIFLAAYIIMAFFLTLERVFSSFLRLLGLGQPDGVEARIGRRRWPAAPISSCYWCRRWPSSGRRAAAPGWAGCRHLPLRPVDHHHPAPALLPRHHRRDCGRGVGWCRAVGWPPFVPSLSFYPQTPYVGRLTSVIELDTGTGRVRALIWSGSAEMMLPHDPLVFPDGARIRST